MYIFLTPIVSGLIFQIILYNDWETIRQLPDSDQKVVGKLRIPGIGIF